MRSAAANATEEVLVAVVVLHLREAVHSVPDERLPAWQTLVAHGHVAVGVVVEVVGVADSVDRVVRTSVAVGLDVEGGQAAGAVVAVVTRAREAVDGGAFNPRLIERFRLLRCLHLATAADREVSYHSTCSREIIA